MMREVSGAQLIRFLAELLAAARGDHRDAFGAQLLDHIEREVGGLARAFRARERSALTGVEHRDRERRRQRHDALLERGERDLLRAEVERVGARMTGVIEEEARRLAGVCVRLQRRFERAQRRFELRAVRREQLRDALGRVIAERREQLGDALRVLLGVAQRRLARSTEVTADDQRVGGRQSGLGIDRVRAQQQAQGQ